ncbi:MAG: hypothetical protein ACLGGX_08120 [Bdellovibrionia bacterium]
MKKNALIWIAVLVLLLMQSFLFLERAQAQRMSDPVPHLRATAQFCSALDDENHAVNCLHATSKANWASSAILPICGEQVWARSQASCVTDLLDFYLDAADVQACRGYSFPEQKVDCLKKLRRPFNVATFFKVPVGAGKSELSELCQSYFFKSDKDRCVQILAQTDFMSPLAVQACSEFFTEKLQLQCLESIRNRWYFDFEVEKCKSLFTDKNKLFCFAGFARKYRLIPGPK